MRMNEQNTNRKETRDGPREKRSLGKKTLERNRMTRHKEEEE